MGRRREPEPPDPPFVPEAPSGPDELEQAIAGLPNDSSVITLYRIPDLGKPRYVTRLTPEEFDLEQIKRQYGGGRFRYVAAQEGIKVQEGHFEIEGDPMLAGRREDPASPVSRDLAALGDKLEKLVEGLARPVSDDKDKLMAVLMAKLLEQKEDGEEALLRKLSAYKAILGGGESSNFAMILDAIKQGMLLSGEGPGASPWIYIMDKLAPSVEKIAGALTTSRGVPEKKPLAPAPAPQVSEAFRPFIPLLKPYLPALIASASVDASPESWADIIEAHIPEKDREAMAGWLRGETWFADLCGLDAKITLQAAWWQELRGFLLEEGQEPGAEEPEPEITE